MDSINMLMSMYLFGLNQNILNILINIYLNILMSIFQNIDINMFNIQ